MRPAVAADRVAGVVAAVLIVSAAAAQDAQIAVREGLARVAYVTAVDSKGVAVADLRPEEITVKENGTARNVLDVRPATEPMQIVMLVDDSGPGLQELRQGVAGFVQIARHSGEVAIITTAKQNTVLVDFTSDPGALLTAVNRLTTRTTSGGYLLEAIRESALTLSRREAKRPAIVVLAIEGTEYSNVSAKQVLDDVRQSGAIVHVLSVGKPSMKTMTAWSQRPTDSIHEALDETIARSTVFAQAPRQSGGRTEQIGQASGIPTRLAQIAYELRDQLAVTYASPASAKPAEKFEVSVKRQGVKVRAQKYGR